MNVCIVAPEFPPVVGGVSNYAYNLAHALVKLGHSVSVITRGSWRRGVSIENIDGIKIYKIRFLPLYPLHIHIWGIFLNKFLNKLDSTFDVIHVHSPISPVVRTTHPVVLTVHSTGAGQVNWIKPVNLKQLLNKLFYMTFRLRMERNCFRNCSLITSVSLKVATELEEYYNIEKKKVIVVKNGVDTNYFVPSNYNKKKCLILYSGRLVTLKGLFDLVDSAKYVCNRFPKISFVIAGNGPLENLLKAKIATLKLSDKIHLIGKVDRAKILMHYQAATMLVIPSHYEGLPTVLLEAMACGLPIVATNVGGITEVATNEENCLVVPAKNPKAIASAILRLLEEPALQVKLGVNARKTAEKHYDWSIIAQSFLSCYDAAIKKTG